VTTTLDALYGFAFEAAGLEAVWRVAKALDAKRPLAAFVPALGLRLGGPFEVLAGIRTAPRTRDASWVHQRFAFDPPELLTVAYGSGDGNLRFGVWVDDVATGVACIAGNHDLGGGLADWGTTLAGALTRYAEGELDAAEDDDDPAWARRLASVIAALRSSARKRASKRKPTAHAGDALGVVVPARAWAKPRIDLLELGIAVALDEKRPVQRAIAEAKAAITRGRAGTALAIGRTLWRAPGTRKDAGSILSAAYTALGRLDHARVATIAARTVTRTMLVTRGRATR